jgi:hypothetical protein
MTVSVVLVDGELLAGIVGIETVDTGDVTRVMGRREVRQENSLPHFEVGLVGDVVLLPLLRNRKSEL